MRSRIRTHRREFLERGAAALAATGVFGRAMATERRARIGRQRLAVDNVCAWPKLTTLPDGTIVAAIFNHPSHQRAPGDIDLWASRDGGGSWQYRGTPAKREPEGTRVNHSIGLANNGDLLVIAGGKVFAENKLVRPWVCRSKDEGKTWHVLKEAFPIGPEGLAFVPFGDIEKAADDALCVAAFVFRPWEKPRRDTVCVVRSDDDGKSWFISATIADRVHNETDLCRLGDGHWLAAARSLVTPDDHRGHSLDLFESIDDAKHWQIVGPVGGGNQHPGHLLKLRDGRVALTVGNRRPGTFGVTARVSADGGRTWTEPLQIAHSAARDCGYPSSVELPNGRVLTAFYTRATEDHPRYHMGVVDWQP